MAVGYPTNHAMVEIVLAKMPYFILKDTALNNLKDTTMTIISQSTTIAKDLLSDTNPYVFSFPQSVNFHHAKHR